MRKINTNPQELTPTFGKYIIGKNIILSLEPKNLFMTTFQQALPCLF